MLGQRLGDFFSNVRAMGLTRTNDNEVKGAPVAV